MNITRIQAFSIHLSLSILIFSSFVAVLYFSWFPGEYFALDGGLQGLQLIGAIDIILGPALTLLLFKQGKKGLRTDMSIIASIQVGALIFGIYAAYQQHTVGVVFAEGKFTTISHQDLQLANATIKSLELTPADFSTLGEESPKQIFTEHLNKESFGAYLEGVLNGKPSLRERTDKYLDLTKHHEQLAKSKLDVETLSKNEAFKELKSLLKQTNKNLEDYEYYNFEARYAKGIAVFDIDRKRIAHLVAANSL